MSILLFVKANGYFEQRRNEQAKYWMYESINEHLRDSFYNNETISFHAGCEGRGSVERKADFFCCGKEVAGRLL